MDFIDRLSREEAVKVLGLNETFTQEEAKDAYRRLCKQCHPDVNGSEFLFRLVKKAYTLVSSDKEPVSEKADASACSWDEAVSHPTFTIPFEQLRDIASSGFPGVVRWNGMDVRITANNLLANLVKSSLPYTVTVRSWSSIWAKWFRRKPMVSCETQLTCKNGVRQGIGASLFFGGRFRISRLYPGYHEVSVSFLDESHLLKFRLKAGERADKKVSVSFKGLHPVYLDFALSVAAE